MGPRALAARRRGRLRARQSGHGGARRVPRRSTATDPDGGRRSRRPSSTPTSSSSVPRIRSSPGVVDALHGRGSPRVRPDRGRGRARRLEGVDEGRARDARACRPRAYRTFGAGRGGAAFAFLETLPGLYVVKTDGLAAGKGVVVTESIAEARDAVRAYLSGDAFGDAGRTCVIEEGLHRARALAVRAVRRPRRAADRGRAGPQARVRRRRGPEHRRHGRVLAGPVRRADDLVDEMMERAIRPTLASCGAAAPSTAGVLYCGLMLTPDGPEGARVQRALRRPRVPGGRAAARERPLRALPRVGGRAGSRRRS